MSGKNGTFRGLKTHTHEKKMVHHSSVPPPLISDDSDDLIETKPGPISFFKIMITNSWNQYMTIPPAYVPQLYHLVDHNVQLKDSLGRLMEVKLSYVDDGSLAFGQGWGDFVSAHNIIRSDFLVFRPVEKSLFEVEIFDRSACTRLKFDEIRTDSNIFKHKSHDLSSILHPAERANSKADDHRTVQSSQGNGSSRQQESCHVASGNGNCKNFGLKDQVARSQYEDHVPQVSAAASEEDGVPCIKIENVDCAKLESVDSDDDYLFTESFNFSLTVSANDQYPFLTEPLPLSRTGTGRRVGKHEAHTVILQDSKMRMWPVLYESNYGSTRFLSGWESFANANMDLERENVCHFRRIACMYMPAAFRVTCVPQNLIKNVGRDSKEVSTSNREIFVEGLKKVVANSNQMRKYSKHHEGEPRKRKCF